MSYVEITAKIKLRAGSEITPSTDSYLCLQIKEEVMAFLDRLSQQNNINIGVPSEFDLNAPLLINVVVVDQPVEPFKPE